MTLALRKSAKIWRDATGIQGLVLIKVLIRDQVIYFVAYAEFFPLSEFAEE